MGRNLLAAQLAVFAGSCDSHEKSQGRYETTDCAILSIFVRVFSANWSISANLIRFWQNYLYRHVRPVAAPAGNAAALLTRPAACCIQGGRGIRGGRLSWWGVGRVSAGRISRRARGEKKGRCLRTALQAVQLISRLEEFVVHAHFDVAADGARSVHRVVAQAAVGQRIQRRDLVQHVVHRREQG